MVVFAHFGDSDNTVILVLDRFYLVLDHTYLVLDRENVPGELVLYHIILVLDRIEFGARSCFFAG